MERRTRLTVHNVLDQIDCDASDFEEIDDSDEDEDFNPEVALQQASVI